MYTIQAIVGDAAHLMQAAATLPLVARPQGKALIPPRFGQPVSVHPPPASLLGCSASIYSASSRQTGCSSSSGAWQSPWSLRRIMTTSSSGTGLTVTLK